MKKTKSTVMLLIFLAILALGIGYAAITKTLQINGTLGATVDDSNFVVKFTQATHSNLNRATATVSEGIVNEEPIKANFSVTGFTTKGDSVVFEYTIANQSTDFDAGVTASVADLSDFANKDYFSVKASFADNSELASTTIAAEGTAKLYVTVSCTKTPLDEVTAATKEGIVTITATAKAKTTA